MTHLKIYAPGRAESGITTLPGYEDGIRVTNIMERRVDVSMNNSKAEVVCLPFGNRVVFYGPKATDSLYPKLREHGFKRLFICTDQGLSGLEMFCDFVDSLEEAGFETVIYDGIQPNPTVENVEEGKRTLLKSRADCVIGFGGGSSLDSAKMIAAMAYSEGNIEEYTSHYENKREFSKRKHYTVAVPTTAGTGSEMDNCACVVNDAGRKLNVFGEELKYDLAIVDSDYLANCPPKVTAACGIDALCHSLEQYIGKPDMVFNVCALKAVDLAVKNLEKACAGDNQYYREQMMMASILSGFMLTVSDKAETVPIHSIALPLSMKYHLAHGESLAAVLPYVLDRVATVRPGPVAAIGRYVGIGETDDRKCAKEFCIALQRLIQNIGLELPSSISMEKEALQELARTAIISKSTTDNGILPCDYNKCLEIYREVGNHKIIE